MLAYIIEAAAFLFTVSLFSNIFSKLGYNVDYKSMVIGFLVMWVAGKMALRRYLIKLDERNAAPLKKKKAKKHN